MYFVDFRFYNPARERFDGLLSENNESWSKIEEKKEQHTELKQPQTMKAREEKVNKTKQHRMQHTRQTDEWTNEKKEGTTNAKEMKSNVYWGKMLELENFTIILFHFMLRLLVASDAFMFYSRGGSRSIFAVLYSRESNGTLEKKEQRRETQNSMISFFLWSNADTLFSFLDSVRTLKIVLKIFE